MESELRKLLFSSISEFADNRELDIDYPNVSFETEEEGKDPIDQYLKVSVTPISPDEVTVCDGGSIYQWIYQVSVFYRDGVGEVKPYAIVDELKDFYHILFEFIGEDHLFQIVKTPDSKLPVPTKGWYSIPVQFRIQTSC